MKLLMMSMRISFATYAFAMNMRLLIQMLLQVQKSLLEIKSLYAINVIQVFIKDATSVNL